METSNPRTIESIKAELEKLAKRHSRLLDIDDNRHQDESTCNTNTKKKRKSRKYVLEPRHIQSDFHGEYQEDAEEEGSDDASTYYLDRFEQFAVAVCKTRVIPRKELFEAWAMALYVHHYFPPSNQESGPSYSRVADLCSGHGLVSWAILFLDSTHNRTAVCIDKNIPKSCDIVESVMLQDHPEIATFPSANENSSLEADAIKANETNRTHQRIRKRWHWVEGDICQNVSADASTLIVGVHCCGTLSDTILDLAISSRSGLALVPCCHTRRSLPKEYKNRPHRVFDDILEQNVRHNKSLVQDVNDESKTQDTMLPTTLTDYIDTYRMQKLRDAGFDVQEENIPSVITPKNRIIVATPRQDVPINECTPPTKITPKYGKMPFVIPLTNTPQARGVVESQSGRLAADLRNRKPPVRLCLSLYLPEAEYALTEENLQDFCSRVCSELQVDKSQAPVHTKVSFGSHGPFHHPTENRYSRGFVVHYQVFDPTGKHPQVTKERAKYFHETICERIISGAIPGISLRQGIRKKAPQTGGTERT